MPLTDEMGVEGAGVTGAGAGAGAGVWAAGAGVSAAGAGVATATGDEVAVSTTIEDETARFWQRLGARFFFLAKPEWA